MKPKILYSSKHFILEHRKKRFSKQPYYRITWRAWGRLTSDDRDDIVKMLDPKGTRTKQHVDNTGWYWNYHNKTRAEQHYMMLLLRWA